MRRAMRLDPITFEVFTNLFVSVAEEMGVTLCRTSFSPSPIHLLMSDEALMLKKVAPLWCAMALPMRVLPVPGGPNSSKPRGSARRPWKRSGLLIGLHSTTS